MIAYDILLINKFPIMNMVVCMQHRIWNPTWTDGKFEISNDDSSWGGGDVIKEEGTEEAIGFSVKNAVLFPTEVEKGMWPEDYSLSDHARLTVVFSPIKMPCSGHMT